eukprot:symbB.v1.2.022832.t1/scaffold2043.1/size110972/6
MILQCDGPNLLGLVHCPKSRAAFSLAEAFSLALALLFAADFFGGAEAAEIGADRSMEGKKEQNEDCAPSIGLLPWKSGTALIVQQYQCLAGEESSHQLVSSCITPSWLASPELMRQKGGKAPQRPVGPDRLLDFVESRADPQAWDQKTAAFGLSAEQEDAGLSASWGDGQYMQPAYRYGGGRLVDYFSQDCVHCQHLKPVWKNAQRMWNEEHPGADNVQWEEKECFGPRWEPGKDYGECQAQGIHSFPTVRFHPYNSDDFEDFTAQRTAKNLLNFLDERAAPDNTVPAPVATAKVKDAKPILDESATKDTTIDTSKDKPKKPKESPEKPVVPVVSPPVAPVKMPSVPEVMKAKETADLKAPEQAMVVPLPCLPADAQLAAYEKAGEELAKLKAEKQTSKTEKPEAVKE